MYSNILNNWFYGEDVQVDDMKLLTKSFLQLCFAANGGNVMATGITPTITGNNIATTKGFVYFGETSDAIFIERTGTNQLISFVDPTSVPLIANGYLYVKPRITYDTNNRTSTVSGIVYTSTSATAEGINLATITNSVITQVNSINPLGATQLQRGITQIATQIEVNAGTVANKAVSPRTFAVSAQLASKAPLVSPELTGTPTAPTAAKGTNTTQLATMAALFAGLADKSSLTGAAFTGAVSVLGVTTQGQGIIASDSNKYGWWRKFADGTIMQGGYSGSLACSGYNNVTLPIAFTSVIQSLTIGLQAVNGTPQRYSIGIIGNGLTNVYIYNTDAAEIQSCSYLAIGR